MVTNKKSISIIAGIIVAAAIGGSISYYYYSLSQSNRGNTDSEDLDDNSKFVPRVLPADSTIHGLTYSEWTARWWVWLLSVPLEKNPAADANGQFCAENQNDDVWYLPGTFGGAVDRVCEVPSGRPILIALINTVCDPAEYPDLQTESEMRSCAKAGNDSVTELSATIDGVELEEDELREYRVDSPLFNVTLPENNIFGLPAQTTPAVSDGYWLFLEPLADGTHNIHYRGAKIDASDPSQNFVSEARYTINVR